MNRGYRYTLRLGQRARLRRRLTAGVLASFAVCALAAVCMQQPEPIRVTSIAAPAPQLLAAAPAESGKQRPARIVYPYSVVPGGVASQAELVRIVRTDKVVAAHYASFDVASARPVTVAAPRAVHVSYRKGDQVYWTAKKVMLKAGETLYTDGRNEMRARCANRISDVARFPVEAQDPDLELLEASFAEGVEEENGALVTVGGPELGDAVTNTAKASSVPFVSTAGASQAASWRAPLDAGGLGLAPRFGDLRNMGLLSTGWTVQPGTSVGSGSATDPVRGSAPPILVAVDTPAQPDEVPPSDPDPFIPKTDPARPLLPDSTLPDATKPADVPEPGTPWLLAAALTALLALRRKD
ncbi:PEP-CTERM sorting domain-containing protein [Massilia suwonensis]|uniref:PEP-CTERM sorting domain-containing protein n=1 Tax=Massilia suwonensis TaxID=648895 RepID=A0ABW0MLK1_9BURK